MCFCENLFTLKLGRLTKRNTNGLFRDLNILSNLYKAKRNKPFFLQKTRMVYRYIKFYFNLAWFRLYSFYGKSCLGEPAVKVEKEQFPMYL